MPTTSELSPVRIALLDDDSGLRTVMERRFSALRWQWEALSYAPAAEQLASLRVQVLLLNPALTGMEYIEQLAAEAPALGLLVIASQGTVADRVRALRGGADDWIAKPVHPEELVARVQAVMRRRRAGERCEQDGDVAAGELVIRPDRFDAYVDDEPAGLSRKEFELLRQLAAAEGRVLEREVVYQRVWGYMMVRGDRSVDVFVRKLRTKLERLSPEWRYVHTHFGVGYRFAAEPVTAAGAAGTEAIEGATPVESAPSPSPQADASGGGRSAPPPAPSASPGGENPAVPLDLALSR
ncbi:MAG TPA: response regulator transcription factor [Solirubrobacteraceae bacterium]|nr:response regulator transcription factor [Solirubrobacteraceae bacterium]